jgi:pimeloyl-ACP methyl ester carboxylesterase
MKKSSMPGFSISSLAILSLVSLASTLPNLASRSTAAPSITWSNCTASDPPSLDCGSIQVPLDYSQPDGETITLVITRLKAPAKTRLGNLVYNPGGPGGAASDIIIPIAELGFEKAPLLSQNLIDHYDIIGLDPRGVGLSVGVSCDPELWNARKSIYPTSEKEFDDMVTANKAFFASCANLTGPLFNNLDTTSVAKDYEQVRLALNEGKMNYFAQSYGSQIGEQYAELYPENIGRMALDGILDHSTSEISGINVEVSLPSQ